MKYFDLLTKNTAIYSTTVITFGLVIGSFFSYLLQFLLARLLSINDYGAFNALISLYVIVSVPILALTTALIKKVSELRDSDNFKDLSALFIKGSIVSLIFGLIFGLIIILFNDSILQYFKLEKETRSVEFFALYVALSFVLLWPTAYLQGLLRYKAFAFFSALSGIVRFAFPVIFVYFGYRVGGVFLGFSFYVVLMYIISLMLLKKNYSNSVSNIIKNHFVDILKLSIITFFISVGLSLLNNIDVIQVRHFFGDEPSGIYAAVVTIGKIFLFGAGMITIIMFPQISNLKSKNQNFLKRFLVFLILQIITILVSWVVFYLFSAQIVSMLFGAQFLVAVPYVFSFSIFVGFYILINFLIMYLLAIGDKISWVFLLITAVLQYILLYYFNSSLEQVIFLNIILTGSLLSLLTVYSVFYTFKSLKGQNEALLS